MKQIKRILALAVALALAFTLATPAMAATDWNGFFVVRLTDTYGRERLYIPHGESITLTAQANIPDGVDEVAYQWYWCYSTSGWYENPIEGATTDTLRLSPGDDGYPAGGRAWGGAHAAQFHCEVTAIDNGDGQSKKDSTGTIAVYVEGSFWEKLYSVTLGPLAEVFQSIDWSDPLMILFVPLAYLLLAPVIIDNYFTNFSALFPRYY